ncbi:glycerophosphoryl diester phosphodiesterase [Mucilaginibacter yixingensis]|uniref:Glycerophosphoryl diester phosphodiesterase n=1 Tax=Mucilaginibacter yixingensis TaxID=1295612 RepID=A0A2T5J4P9_9SPHI|nr:hypothetical protein [Mucilaginibacter yixingensis]PTQ92638.1 glycerophosphoryl diester phosphodiesterase [Mucilaginibacter yixingensis]
MPLKYLSLLLLLLIGRLANAQQLPNAHSHNDYNKAEPFDHAYRNGFGSIEADVFLRKGRLLVSHDTASLSTSRSLTRMYLKPLRKALKKDTSRRITLLVDLKESYSSILPELIRELKPLRKFCKGYNLNGRLQILISGNRPLPALFVNYPDYLWFDEDLKHPYDAVAQSKIGQISLRFSDYASWKGVGPMPAEDEQRVKAVIKAVHAMHKPIRFWDAPDSPAGWTKLLQLGVDMIGTDHIDELTAFWKQR